MSNQHLTAGGNCLSPRSFFLATLLLGAGFAVFAKAQLREDSLRATLDVASQGVYVATAEDYSGAYFVGLDLHRVFTSERCDFGPLTVQPYFVKIENMAMHPSFLDGSYDSAVEHWILNFNYTGMAVVQPTCALVTLRTRSD